MKPEMIKKTIIRVIPAAFLVALSAFLLKGDVWTFWTWYLLAGVLGIVGMAVTGRLFRGFADKGWMFSKVVFITITGFLTWFLVSVRILKFTTVTCVGITAAFGVVCIFLYERQRRQGYDCLPIENLDLVYAEEILFFAVFLLWTYLAGFHPAAHGTEKFMDYGFMEAMMRSKTLPATDLWYSQGKINYYYGGQYFAVFLTKLSGTKVELTYNLMRTFVAAFAFVLPFSLVHQMTLDMQGRVSGWKKNLPSITGFLAGLAVSIAGNMHYVVYAQIIPLIQKLKGEEVSSYWFPDATRYIGFNPDVPDKTIHEFPCYSFVLGDLHAHVVNIMFVLLLLGLLYAWMKKVQNTTPSVEKQGRKKFWMKQLLILWGLPTVLTLVFVISLIVEKLKGLEHKSLYRLMKAVRTPDLFAVIMGLCAIGLVAIPELVYVRDIYENGNARANTMFKLTYQAYIMFGMTMAYVIFRLLIVNRKKILKAIAAIGLVLLLWTCGYFGRSVNSWFGQVLDPSQYKGLNATAFLETDYVEDVGAIKWLKENIEGSPVVLEANGDSYSEYERVSAMTGLPTVMGWYVHEWLWRNDVADLNEKSGEIETIYTSTDTARVQELIEKYDISYIFVGSCEREKYGENLNNAGLDSLGEIVYQDSDYETYIVKIEK